MSEARNLFYQLTSLPVKSMCIPMKMARIEIADIPQARTALKSDEIFRFQDVLDDRVAKKAIDAFLAALDRPDVLIGVVVASSLDVPGMVPVCLALGDDYAFLRAVKADSRLRKLLGLLLRVRLADLGLRPRGRKGMVSRWTDAFQLAEIYQATAATAKVVTVEGDHAGRLAFFLSGSR